MPDDFPVEGVELTHLLVVSDIGRAVAFYRDVLGLQETFRRELHGEWFEEVTGIADAVADCVFFDLPGGGARIELLCFRRPQGRAMEGLHCPFTIGVRHFAFLVEDLEDLLGRLRNAGVEPCSEPVTVPFPVGEKGLRKRLCYFHDPEGVLLEDDTAGEALGALRLELPPATEGGHLRR